MGLFWERTLSIALCMTLSSLWAIIATGSSLITWWFFSNVIDNFPVFSYEVILIISTIYHLSDYLPKQRCIHTNWRWLKMVMNWIQMIETSLERDVVFVIWISKKLNILAYIFLNQYNRPSIFLMRIPRHLRLLQL